MYSFRNFLQDLSVNTNIKFRLVDDEKNEIFSGYDLKEVNEIITINVSLSKTQAYLSIPKAYEVCLPLLKYTIENKYIELFSIRQQLLNDILDGKEVSLDKVEKNFSFLSKGCTLFFVSVDGSRYEALSIIRELYSEQDIVSIIYGDNIVVIGMFEETIEHARSIRESIISDLYCRCYVSFSDLAYDTKSLKKSYEDSKECMMLRKKFDIKDEIFSYNKMLFEKVVYNINPSVKQELMVSFKDKFNVFDSEMITTIEEFINSGLNISDAARKLYIHRNTLIYRLDKINKETGFDIRNFKEATVFIIAFLVWKEMGK